MRCTSVLLFQLIVVISCSNLDFETRFVRVADTGLFPEGPAFDGEHSLYFSNCNDNWIGRYRDGNLDTFAVAPSQPDSFLHTNGLIFGRDGYLYGCEFTLGRIVKFDPSGNCTTLVNGYNGKRFNRPNDLTFDRQGNLWFTDPKNYGPDKADGSVYFYSISTHLLLLAADSLCFPNGIAFDPEGQFLYVSESAREQVVRFSVLPGGRLGRREVFVRLPGGDPDGLAFDQKGNLYVAHFGGGAVLIFDPRGKLLARLRTPGQKPSNLEFAGPGRRTLYITEDETNALYKIAVPIPGLPLVHSP